MVSLAFSDSLFLVIFAVALIVVVVTLNYIMGAVFPTVQDDIPVSMNSSLNNSWDRQVQFANNSFAAIWFMFAVVSIALAFLIKSHPILLFAWLMFNVVLFFVYDSLSDFLTDFLASSLNDENAMDVAVSFFQSDIPKAIVIINLLLGFVLFGKGALRGVGE